MKLASKLVGWHIEVRAEGHVEDALKRAEGLFAKKPEGVASEVPPPEGEVPAAAADESASGFGDEPSAAPSTESPEVGAKEGEPAVASPAEGMDVDAKADEPGKE